MKKWLLLLLTLLLGVPIFAQTQPASANLTAQDSGACTTANACLVVNLAQGTASSVIQLNGTFSGTVQFEGTASPGGTFVSILGVPVGGTTAVSSATATGAWRFTSSGLSQIRARVSIYTSGTIAVVISSSTGSSGVSSGGSGGGTGNPPAVIQSLPTGTCTPIAGQDSLQVGLSNGDGAELSVDGGACVPLGAAATPQGTAGQILVSGTAPPVLSSLSVYNVDTFPYGGCMVGATTYTTNLDCAFYTALAASAVSDNTTTIVLGTGYYNTCAGLVEPTTFATVNIIGQGVRNSFINATCSHPSSPVISKPVPSQRGNLVLRDFSIQANGDFNSCADLFGMEGFYVGHINCYTVIASSGHQWEFGSGFTGQESAEDGTVDQLNADNTATGIGYIFYASDSRIYNIQTLSGTTEGIQVNGGNNVFIGAHPDAINVGIQDNANNIWVGTELDTIGTEGFDFESTGSSVVGTNSYNMANNSVTFYFGSGAGSISFGAQGALNAGGTPATGWNEFATSAGAYPAHPLPSGVTIDQVIICAGQQALPTTAMASGTKYGASSSAPLQITCPGLLTTDRISLTFASDPSGVTGYAPSASGMLTLVDYPDSGGGKIDVYQYNNTANSITPSAMTVNYVGMR